MNTIKAAAMASAFIMLSTPAFAYCLPRNEMHKTLNHSGYFLSVSGLDKNGHLTSYWLGGGSFVLLIEDVNNACVLASGDIVWNTKELET